MTRQADRQTFKNEDLVLKVSTNIDPAVWDEAKYEAFVDELCGNREYQKDATRTVMRFLAGQKYRNLRELAKETFDSSPEMERRYGSWAGMERHLQLPDQLSCSIDMATGTGKSYVLYGLAAILLAEGIVDRVLVLCPSNTIEDGLLTKFRDLAGNADLRAVLPAGARVCAPKIVNASETIVDGSICVENYHAILKHVKSSIRDSLIGRGARVAVFNDETHHEWIVSVSMLSEGWDVKNVFQIVPHEERAFNSKLLIAQVLGRGLRRPDGWQGADPVVTVFNHDAWVGRIRHLVDEILEMENRLSSSVVPGSPYHFDLHNLDYTRETDATLFTKKGEYRLLEQGSVDLPDQVEVEDVAIEFETAVSGIHTKFKTKIEHKTYSFDEVAEEMYRRLQSIDDESKDAEDPRDRTQYAKKFPFERCLEIVKASAKKARIKSGRIAEDNRQKILQALGPLRRKLAKRVVYNSHPTRCARSTRPAARMSAPARRNSVGVTRLFS